MRAALLIGALCVLGCGGPSAPPVSPGPVTPAAPSLHVSPLQAAFDGPYQETIFEISGVGFAAPDQPVWDTAAPHSFFFLGEGGLVGENGVDLHSWAVRGPMVGLLAVDLLAPDMRGHNFLLCLSIVSRSPPSACSAPILFALGN